MTRPSTLEGCEEELDAADALIMELHEQLDEARERIAKLASELDALTIKRRPIVEDIRESLRLLDEEEAKCESSE